MDQKLTPAALQRLSGEALLTYFGHGLESAFTAHPGCAAVDTGVPVADLNYVVVGEGTLDARHFVAICEAFHAREMPFLTLEFPGASPAVEARARELGLEHVVDFPIMVHEDPVIGPQGNDSVAVRPAQGEADAEANARVLGAAFDIEAGQLLRAIPPSVFDSPAVDTYLASLDGEVVGSVTLTHAGRVSGIWSMATAPDRQRAGIGRRLLSTAMAQARTEGVTAFWLGATPAGKPLYDSLGFTTRTIARVWASGETHQS